MVTDPLEAVKVSTGASGISGTQTAASDVLTTGEIVEEGATVAEPVDQAFNLYLLLKIELPEATCTEVPGATTSVLGAVPEVAPAIV
jgi:hypothetical protein